MRSPEPCPPFEALSAFADGALEASEREQLAAHVGACASCAPLVQSLLDLRRQFVALPDPSPAFDLVPRIEARLAAAASAASARPAQAPRAARPRWWQAALLAPGGAAALALGVWLGGGLLPAVQPRPAGAVAAQMAAFSSVPPGALCLASGSCGGLRR